LPRFSVTTTGGASWLTLAVMADPSQTPSHLDGEVGTCLDLCTNVLTSASPEETGGPDPAAPVVMEEFPPAEAWKESVSAAAWAVRGGSLRKVVLSRGVRVRAGCLNPTGMLRSLRTDYPGCTLFAVARGNRCFLGATPERLVRLRDGEVHVTAIAGSAPRGLTEEEDGHLGAVLLASIKDQIEHAVVVEALRDALATVCTTISASSAPVLLKIQNVQHLYTPLTARLRDRRTVLELVDLLHPTPAVGGVPREDALRWIDHHEGWDRGWYAGVVGWMDGAGEGECAVAIRSALLRDTEALLFAGCGIVADSDPDQEYAESSLKLGAVLSALTGA
jgi:isochorismate synthase